MRFMMMRAENFIILRRKPIPVSYFYYIYFFIIIFFHIMNLILGLRYFFSYYEHAYGNDVQAQISRFYNLFYGRNR